MELLPLAIRETCQNRGRKRRWQRRLRNSPSQLCMVLPALSPKFYFKFWIRGNSDLSPKRNECNRSGNGLRHLSQVLWQSRPAVSVPVTSKDSGEDTETCGHVIVSCHFSIYFSTWPTWSQFWIAQFWGSDLSASLGLSKWHPVFFRLRHWCVAPYSTSTLHHFYGGSSIDYLESSHTICLVDLPFFGHYLEGLGTDSRFSLTWYYGPTTNRNWRKHRDHSPSKTGWIVAIGSLISTKSCCLNKNLCSWKAAFTFSRGSTCSTFPEFTTLHSMSRAARASPGGSGLCGRALSGRHLRRETSCFDCARMIWKLGWML